MATIRYLGFVLRMLSPRKGLYFTMQNSFQIGNVVIVKNMQFPTSEVMRV